MVEDAGQAVVSQLHVTAAVQEDVCWLYISLDVIPVNWKGQEQNSSNLGMRLRVWNGTVVI